MPQPVRSVTPETVTLIQQFEGILDGDPSTVNLDPYLDPVGIWTIGWGHAITYQGKFVRGMQNRALARSLFPGGISMAQALDLLRGELVITARDVQQMVTAALNDQQFGALVSFAFNVGVTNLRQSTLLKKLNARDYAGAADEFLRWTKGTNPKTGLKIDLPGLVKRRSAERTFFLTAVAAQARMPATAVFRRKRSNPAQ